MTDAWLRKCRGTTTATAATATIVSSRVPTSEPTHAGGSEGRQLPVRLCVSVCVHVPAQRSSNFFTLRLFSLPTSVVVPRLSFPALPS